LTVDRIEKTVVLNAPLERVWRAIGDSKEFGTWFGVAFDGPFVQGARQTGRIVPTAVDAEVAKLQKPHEGKAFEVFVERIEQQRQLAFRWHPYAVEPGTDYSKEPTTLVTFALEPAAVGTRLTIMESGFDRLPLARRDAAFEANAGGWAMQAQLIAKYLSGS
jgi:uncharacterized protein YndB with AHSA1/START domain